RGINSVMVSSAWYEIVSNCKLTNDGIHCSRRSHRMARDRPSRTARNRLSRVPEYIPYCCVFGSVPMNCSNTVEIDITQISWLNLSIFKCTGDGACEAGRA